MGTKEKKLIKIVVLIIIFSMIFSPIQSLASDCYTTNKSLQFEQWEQLPEEERKNTIQPAYNELSIVDSVKRSTYNNLVGATSSNLESKYSLLDNQNVDIKNQQTTSLCWAFSFSSVLETTVEKKYGTTLRYSPVYTDYTVSKAFNRNIGDVGNFNIAVATSISGKGAAYESEFPFLKYYDESKNPKETHYMSYSQIDESEFNPRVKIIKSVDFANIFKSLEGNQVVYRKTNSFLNSEKYTEEYILAVRDKIKNHIKNYGAVYSLTQAGWSLNNSLYFNNETNAYYSSLATTADHAVTIIGWDDNYSKENFKEGKQPIHDGAYIVLNSWGESFGNNGCYYISYDDAYIEQYVSGIVEIQEFSKDSDKGYDNIYQYDELGMSYYNFFFDEKYTKRLPEGYLANVFTRQDTSKREVVSEIGIQVPVTEGIEIYVDNENGDMKDYGEKVASYTGSEALEPGYHTLKLSSPVEITGEKFSIIVKYINQEGALYPLECNIKDTGLTNEDGMFYNAKSQNGQSYISIDGNNWTDINESKFYITSTQMVTYKNTNACIKAFTSVLAGSSIIPVQSINLNKQEMILEEGSTGVLATTITPSDATNKNITWKSSNENVATVNGGVVTAKNIGETIITVTTQDGNKTVQCKLIVKAKEIENIPVQSINLNKQEMILEEGSTGVLAITITPSDATNKNITWKSSNESVATVDGGVITAKNIGETIITATTQDGNKTAQCKLTVKAKEIEKISVQSVSLNKTVLTIEAGKTENLISTITPSDATNKNITWKSSNESVATVNGGVITAKDVGEATITVTTQDGNMTAQCKVTVNKVNIISVNKVTLNKNMETMEVGDTINLVATLEPFNATNQNVIWSSSNESIATISQKGIIDAIKEGETTIKVVTEDGKIEDSCKLTVTKKTNIADDIYKEELDEEESNLNLDINENDNTKAQEYLPDTGTKIILLAISIIFIFVIVKFIRYKGLKIKEK